MKNSSKNIKKLVQIGGPTLNDGLLRMGVMNITKNEHEIDLLTEYYFLLTKTDFLNPKVYDVLIKGRSYSYVTEKYDISEVTLKNLIYNESKKVYTQLTQDPYDVVVKHELEAGYLDQLRLHIKSLIRESRLLDKVEIQDFLLFDLTKYVDVDYSYHTKIDSTEYTQLLNKLKPLSKPYLTTLLNSADQDMLSYMSYLIRTPNSNLTDLANKHKKELKLVWWIPDED